MLFMHNSQLATILVLKRSPRFYLSIRIDLPWFLSCTMTGGGESSNSCTNGGLNMGFLIVDSTLGVRIPVVMQAQWVL